MAGLSLFLGSMQLFGLGAFERLPRFLGRGLYRTGLNVTPGVFTILSIGGSVAFTLIPGRLAHVSRDLLRSDRCVDCFDWL